MWDALDINFILLNSIYYRHDSWDKLGWDFKKTHNFKFIHSRHPGTLLRTVSRISTRTTRSTHTSSLTSPLVTSESVFLCITITQTHVHSRSTCSLKMAVTSRAYSSPTPRSQSTLYVTCSHQYSKTHHTLQLFHSRLEVGSRCLMSMLLMPIPL